jgi:hypothetical protein
LTKSFCREYKINQDAIVEGKSGIVIGRYPGDHYAGGNPWQLLTGSSMSFYPDFILILS